MSDEFDKKMANAMVHIDAMSEATDIMHPKTAPTRWLLNLAPAFMLAAIGAGIAADRISNHAYDAVIEKLGGSDKLQDECRNDQNRLLCFDSKVSEAKAIREQTALPYQIGGIGLSAITVGMFLTGFYRMRKEDKEHERLTNEILASKKAAPFFKL